jgi:rubrerythrin
MFGTLKRVVTRLRSRGFHECRHCGTTVDRPTTSCPTCGSGELAHYEV